MMAQTKWLYVLIFYSLLDVLLSIFSLGFYQSPFGFNSTVLCQQLFLTNGFDFRTNGFDLFLLAILRISLLVTGCIMLKKKRPISLFSYISSGIYIGMISYALLKILCFAEYEDQLSYVGIWISIGWCSAASSLCTALWFYVIVKGITAAEAGYTRMEDGEINGNGDISGSASTSTTSTEAKPEITRASVIKHMGRMFKTAGEHWKWFSAGSVFLLLYSGARVFIPYFTGQVVAEIVNAKTGEENRFTQLVLIMIGLTLISTFFGGLRGGSFSYATALVERSMRRDLFASLVRQEIAFFDQNQTGEVVSRLSSDCQTVSSIVSTNVNVFSRNVVMLIGSLCFMVVLSWRLTLVSFISLPLMGYIVHVYGQYYDRMSEKTQTTVAEGNRLAEEVIATMRTVRSFACESRESKRYNERLDNTLKVYRSKCIAYMFYNWLNELAENIVLVAVLFYAGHLAMKGELTVGQATSFLFYQMQIGEIFFNLGWVFSNLMEGVGASRKAFEYINREPEIKYDGKKTIQITGEIVFDKVSFAYPTRPNTDVLSEVSFKIQPGQTVALVGPSGAGKSSIISLIEYFYKCKSGSISLDGTDITQLAHSFYHKEVSLVQQEPILYSGTIRENILYGCDNVSEEEMIDAAKLANAHNFITELESGYDTKCGEKGVQMSGGQKQRIAIARALVRSPSILILDEATSALDSESEYLIQKSMSECAKGRTVIIIAHRLSTIEKADRIFVMDHGRVVQVSIKLICKYFQSGSHNVLMNEEGLYKNLVQRQLWANEQRE